MRKTAFTVRNSQVLEVFTEKRAEGFELWTVGVVRGYRTVLGHHLTHDDLEARLSYAQVGDLTWRDANCSEILKEKHLSAVQEEESIKHGTFVDSKKELQHSVTSHFDVINLFPLDRKVWNAAKRAILGRWTDDIATVVFVPNSKLEWCCPLDQEHPLNIGARIHGHKPDWWNFASWQLPLLSNSHKCGIRLSVIRVDESELHVLSVHRDRLAHILRRIS